MVADGRNAAQSPPGLSREELAAISQELASFFPQPFDETRVVLMLVDPYHVHAYWQIRLDHLDSVRAQIGPGGAHLPIVLRFYDITLIDFSRQPAHRSFDVQVNGLQNNWYVDLWEDSKSYVADVGLRKPDGSVAALARSNIVHTPRAAESPDYGHAGLVLEPDGTVRGVPDFLQAGATGAVPRQPTPATPQDECERAVRACYERLASGGGPGSERTDLPALKRTRGEF